MVVIYQEALSPKPDIPFCTTPRELPPPISVAASVPAIKRGPNRLPATIKSVLLVILVEEYQPIHNINRRYTTTIAVTIMLVPIHITSYVRPRIKSRFLCIYISTIFTC